MYFLDLGMESLQFQVVKFDFVVLTILIEVKKV